MPHYKLTYFDLKGIAEPIRYIFAYAGQEFEDIRVKYEDWPKVKSEIPYGKLPVLEEDGKFLNQSGSITRYLAKKFGLVSKDDWEAAQDESLVDTLGDIRLLMRPLWIETDEKKKDEVRKQLSEVDFPFYFEKFEKMVASNPSGYLVGLQLTWADIVYAQTLNDFNGSFPGVLDSYPALQGLIKKVHSIPNIKKWLETSPKSVTRPL